MPIKGLAALETARPAPILTTLVRALLRHPGATVLNLIEDMLDAEAGHPHVVIFCQGGPPGAPNGDFAH